MNQEQRKSERIKTKYFHNLLTTKQPPSPNAKASSPVPAERTPVQSSPERDARMGDDTAAILAEIRSSREEIRSFREEVNGQLETLSVSMTEIRQSVSGLKNRMDAVENRTGENENGCALNQRLISYLLQREKQLETRCEQLECASRRNSIRIFGIPEDAESGNVVKWGEKFIKEILQLPAETELRLERMHRSLVRKPDATAPPRSFIAKFLDFNTKEDVLMRAWKTKELKYKGNRIGFDNDHPPAVQRRRKEYADIKKQLKAKNITFKSRHPARLLVELPNGTKIFNSAWEAAEGLAEHGIKTTLSEWERLEREQRRIGWQIVGRDGTGGAAKMRGVLQDAAELLKPSGD